MAEFVEVPVAALAPDVLGRLLEEFASRDGTDYGARELTLEEKVAQLRAQLDGAALHLLFETENQQWDLVDSETAKRLL
ncbi:MAG: hypothetical protein CSA53_06790 [Gammaproteobacteria bacterium]|nr:MAG: hypothetical protein CSA53_06790 [Gammaproteobacteria bacterium]